MNLANYSSDVAASGLNFFGFNQDAGCFACGTDDGFRVFNVEPFSEMFRREFASGGIGIVEMLFRSNILALVGGGQNPRHPKDKVIIWNDHEKRAIGELSFTSGDVKGVKLYSGRIIVVLERRTYVYNFHDLKVIHRSNTQSNPLGLCCVSYRSEREVVAILGMHKGQVVIHNFSTENIVHIEAHESDIYAMALNEDGTLLATASEKGTIIRIFNCDTGEKIHELRRGADRAIIHCLRFNADSSFLVCSSDKCTIHVFVLNPDFLPTPSSESESTSRSATHASSLFNQLTDVSSSLSFVRGFLPETFNASKSYAQFRIPESHVICAFGTERYTIVALGASGKFWKASFRNEGECEQLSYHQFITTEDDQDI